MSNNRPSKAPPEVTKPSRASLASRASSILTHPAPGSSRKKLTSFAPQDFDLDDFYRQVGAAISYHRKRAELTQDQLAGVLGVTRSSIANVENGLQRSLFHSVLFIASAIGVDVTEIVPETLSKEVAQAADTLRAAMTGTGTPQPKLGRRKS